MNNQIQPKQSMAFHNLRSQSVCPRPLVEIQILTSSESPSSTHQSYQYSITDDKQSFNQIEVNDEQSTSKKSEMKLLPKHKINKKRQKKCRNARMRRFISPKSPLVVFSELFKGVEIPPIKFQISPYGYTAILKIKDQIYTGKHFTKSQAKQNVCESFFRKMLADKMRSSFEEHSTDIDMRDSDNSTVPKPKRPLQDEFPWLHFASLAMHHLINHWKLQSFSNTNNLQEESNGHQLTPMAQGMKNFPDDPRIYNPVHLLYIMMPGIQFITTVNNYGTPRTYQIECNIDNIPFLGLGSSIKKAKKECSIAAIKYFWKFDFHAIENTLC